MNTSSKLEIPGSNSLIFSHSTRRENASSFYYVESGSVDLYCLISYQGALLPYFILSFQEGEWIYPFPTLLAPFVHSTYFETRPHTELLEVPLSLLENKLKEDIPFSSIFLDKIANYIKKISKVYLFPSQNKADFELSEHEEITVREKHTFRLRKGQKETLSWLNVTKGSIRLLEHPFELILQEGESLPFLTEFHFESLEK